MSILQTKPSSRPKLDGIMEHSFFSRGGAYTPSTLLESSLRESPPAYQSSGKTSYYYY